MRRKLLPMSELRSVLQSLLDYSKQLESHKSFSQKKKATHEQEHDRSTFPDIGQAGFESTYLAVSCSISLRWSFLLLVDLKVIYKTQLGLLLVAEDSNQTQPVHVMQK